MSAPEITVVVPVYNRAAQVAASIESVLAQDFADFEIVVVDDGSSDGTAQVVEAIADARVRCIRQAVNSGVCAARNRGVREARAPLIAFLDSDDRFLPHKLGFVARYFAEHPDIDVLLDSFEVVYPPSMDKAPAPRRNPDLSGSAAIEQAIFARRIWKATPALSARRQALFDAGLFDETLRRRVDMDLILRLTRTARCAATSAVLWRKFWTSESISAAADTFIPALIEICRRHPDYARRSEFRSGLARDVARHLLRQARRGDFAALRRDIARLRAFQGGPATARLFFAGLGEMSRRSIAKARARRGDR